MKKRGTAWMLALMTLPLCSCREIPYWLGYTNDLGNYVVENVAFVPKPPDSHDDYKDVHFLRIDLASSSMLDIGPRTQWIGVASDFCPLRDDHKLIALGPYVEGADQATLIREDTPAIMSADGMFRYHVYLHPEFPIPRVTYGAPTSGPNAQADYNLIGDGRDLCLQIVGGDHYNVFARSSVIEVDAQSIMKAAASRIDPERDQLE